VFIGSFIQFSLSGIVPFSGAMIASSWLTFRLKGMLVQIEPKCKSFSFAFHYITAIYFFTVSSYHLLASINAKRAAILLARKEIPMSRSILINIHLYLAAFFAPIVLMLAISGGLYLLGVKGNVEQTNVQVPADSQLDLDSNSLQTDVESLLQNAGIAHEFEYIKRKGNVLYTRPTSREHYQITQSDSGLEITRNTPSVQAGLIELHKGHGPLAFKTLQKFTAVGLIIVLLSGVWLGLASDRLRKPTLISSGAGFLLFLLLGLL